MTNTNTNDIQTAVALWKEADATKGSADVTALAALAALASAGEFYTVKIGETHRAVTIADIVNSDDAKVRTAARDGFFVAFGGFEAGDKIPNACLTGLNRVIRPALLLAHDGVTPTLKTVKADGRETVALSGVPFALCADYPLLDKEGKETPDFATLVDREVEFYAEKGEEVAREVAAERVLNAPVTLHPAFKARGKLKAFTNFARDLGADAVKRGIVPAPKGRAPRTVEERGNAFSEALAVVLAGMETVTGDDESGLAFTREIDAKLAKLAALIEAYDPDVNA
jgi:hypothetical protein